MKTMMTPKCKRCKKRVLMIDDGSGLPAMMGFQCKNGKTLNICRNCMIEMGKDVESGNMEEWNKLLEGYK